jgi:hypothetical protein
MKLNILPLVVSLFLYSLCLLCIMERVKSIGLERRILFQHESVEIRLISGKKNQTFVFFFSSNINNQINLAYGLICF